MPVVTVLMAVYNAEKNLREAVDSILNQSLKDFEFIIINDGSADKTKNIIESYSDNRIVLINNEKNIGQADSLNLGIRRARGDFLARMDGDDISFRNRLEKQSNFLKNNEDIGVLGTGMILMDENGKEIGQTCSASNHCLIKWNMFFLNPMSHPTVMIRRDLINFLEYKKQFNPADDYELWTRLVFKAKFQNLSSPLVRYRIHDESLSKKFSGIQTKNTLDIQWDYILKYVGANDKVKKCLVEYKTEKSISLIGLLRIVYLYKRILSVFMLRENVSGYENRGIRKSYQAQRNEVIRDFLKCFYLTRAAIKVKKMFIENK